MSTDPVINAEAISALYDAFTDMAKSSGLFDRTPAHESRSEPGTRLTLETLMGPIRCVGRTSGLASTSARAQFTLRIRAPRASEPDDDTERAILYAAVWLMTAINEDYELRHVQDTVAGLVQCVDVLGMYGEPLSSEPGWLEQNGAEYRAIAVTVGVILNDVFPQGGA